ncbi:hypothetical protein [Cryobacterium sp. GrIS_2_6]|uniref:hypothetical protein n=1 Tax=Cryobacterium sp. GrIS_2_6 TaxID=3162785 RepID=UPI002DFD9A54|nr:hypothetical protein [Cryobacterium psychrotolerans]
MKKTTRITLISGIVVAVAAAIAAIGIGVLGAGQPANMSQNGSPGTEAVSGVSTSTPPADASSPLPTEPVAVPSTATEYVASWRLEGSSGNTLYIVIVGPGSGCTTLGYVQVSETTTTVTVTPYVIYDQKPGVVCTADLALERGTITLAAPLGDRTLIHGATTDPRLG